MAPNCFCLTRHEENEMLTSGSNMRQKTAFRSFIFNIIGKRKHSQSASLAGDDCLTELEATTCDRNPPLNIAYPHLCQNSVEAFEKKPRLGILFPLHSQTMPQRVERTAARNSMKLPLTQQDDCPGLYGNVAPRAEARANLEPRQPNVFARGFKDLEGIQQFAAEFRSFRSSSTRNFKIRKLNQ
ncbi:unnamed protein product [Dicrocoelium dendriticum]|nr:unnamed protein product [Dicrocoelium dendriticum]